MKHKYEGRNMIERNPIFNVERIFGIQGSFGLFVEKKNVVEINEALLFRNIVESTCIQLKNFLVILT